MADETYESILDRQWDDIPEVQVLPVGSWLLKGKNAVHMPAKSADANESILFVYEPKEPMDDVDEVELKALGADYDFAENRIYGRFWIETGRDLDSIRNHLEKHGVDTKGASIKDSLEAFKGTEVVAYLGTRNYTDASGELRTDNDPTSYASAE